MFRGGCTLKSASRNEFHSWPTKLVLLVKSSMLWLKRKWTCSWNQKTMHKTTKWLQLKSLKITLLIWSKQRRWPKTFGELQRAWSRSLCTEALPQTWKRVFQCKSNQVQAKDFLWQTISSSCERRKPVDKVTSLAQVTTWTVTIQWILDIEFFKQVVVVTFCLTWGWWSKAVHKLGCCFSTKCSEIIQNRIEISLRTIKILQGAVPPLKPLLSQGLLPRTRFFRRLCLLDPAIIELSLLLDFPLSLTLNHNGSRLYSSVSMLLVTSSVPRPQIRFGAVILWIDSKSIGPFTFNRFNDHNRSYSNCRHHIVKY